MKKMTNWEELKWRGLVKDVAGEDIEDKINNDHITFYWGTDPTADSLHLGHYSSLVTAKRLMKMGHNPILLCGGATGRIGDPRPTSEREIISIETLNKNIESIRKQIDKIFASKAKIVNNYDWFKGYEFLDFLRDENLLDKIPVVIITGDDTEETIKKAFSYGILDVLNKPFTEDNIKRILTSINNYYERDNI